MAHLIIQSGDGRTSRVDVTQPSVVLGRDAGCDIPIDDAITSRRHLRIYRDDWGKYWIQDLRSKNGTLLNDLPITLSRLNDGDWIKVGASRLQFVTDGDDQTGTARPQAPDPCAETIFGSQSAWGGHQRLDLNQKRLETLYELNERLTGLFDRDELLGEVLTICVELLRFERAGIAIRRKDSNEPRWIELRDVRPGAKEEFRISRSLVQRALNQGERILLTDTASEHIDPTASMISNNIRSAMCVPMAYLNEVRGVVYGDRTTSAGGYTKADLDFFAALGRLGAMGLANAALVEEMRQHQRVELQVKLGREIQTALFPSEPLQSAGLTICALNDPGQIISGDYYDFFAREDGLIAVVIADVAGKGIPAALLMANLQAAVHVLLATETDLVHVADRLNRLICQNVSDAKFITGIFGLFNPASRTFTYVNAGHLWPYLMRPGGAVERLNLEPSLPLGIEPDYLYEQATFTFDDGPFTLLLYTDGIPEAENEQREQFQETRFFSVLKTGTELPPQEVAPSIRRSIKQFTRNHPQTDDITMLVIHMDA